MTGPLVDRLGDVLITSPSDNDILYYDTASGKWKNKSPLENISHIDLSDMPDVGGINSDHDARYVPAIGGIFTGQVTHQNNLIVTHNSTTALRVQLSDATTKFNIDTSTNIAQFGTDIDPTIDNTFDLGWGDDEQGMMWRNIYLKGNLTDGDGVNAVSVANLKSAYDHSQNNSQAHTDYLINNGNDTTSGGITADYFHIDATADHTITDSSDDLVFTNPNQDKDILFNINTGGTQYNFVTIDSSLPSFKLSNDGNIGVSITGIMNISGTWTGSSIGTILTGSPTIAGGNFAMFYFSPIVNTAGVINALDFRPTYGSNDRLFSLMYYISPAHASGYDEDITFLETSISRQYLAGNDTSSVNIRGIKLGGAVASFDAGTDNVTFVETMVDFTGGATRYGGTGGTFEQVALRFTGFGTQSGLTASDKVRALEADGGIFSLKKDNGASPNISKWVFGTGEDGEIYVTADNFYFANITQDKDIILSINDGGATKTITWDGDVDKLKHSSGTFDFDDDNIITTGKLDLGGGTLEIPNGTDPDITVEGEIAWDTDDDSLRGFDGTNQVVVGQKVKTIDFSVLSPDLIPTITGRSTQSLCVWYNNTGFDFNITEIRGIADTDNYTFILYHSASATDIGTANDVPIDTVVCSTNGTSCFYMTITSGFDHAVIETGTYLIFEHSANTANFVEVHIQGWLNANVA